MVLWVNVVTTVWINLHINQLEHPMDHNNDQIMLYIIKIFPFMYKCLYVYVVLQMWYRSTYRCTCTFRSQKSVSGTVHFVYWDWHGDSWVILDSFSDIIENEPESAIYMLGLQLCTTNPNFYVTLGDRTQVLIFVWQTLY